MTIVFSFILAILLTYFCLPIFKEYQQEGYNLKYLVSFFKSNVFKNKTPLKYTRRIERYLVAFYLILSCLTSVYFYYLYDKLWAYITFIFIIFPICMFISALAHIVMLPIEHMIARYFVEKARKKLKSSSIIKIGITGSYGKTTTKNILNEILSKKYRVCASPKSYNTPMGLTRTILENLKEDDNVLILEMGARHVRDIDELCKLYGVDYGIITSIGPQHLETFKTIENIEAEKTKLALNATKFTVFGGESTLNAYNNCNNNKILVGIKDSFAYISDVKISTEGSQFMLNLDKAKLKCKTRLLGEHNLHDIMCASALAKLLNVTNDDIIEAIESLKPIPHRLELIKTDYFTILDDSYNSNVVGVKEALKILNEFDCKKIIITPGIVELGKFQYQENYEFGRQIAKVCDYCIIMNKVNRDAILEGLKKENYDLYKVKLMDDLNQAVELLKTIAQKGDCILFENDLPDKYK